MGFFLVFKNCFKNSKKLSILVLTRMNRGDILNFVAEADAERQQETTSNEVKKASKKLLTKQNTRDKISELLLRKQNSKEVNEP